MPKSQISREELINQILSVGRDLAKQSKEHTQELTAKGKKIAAKGEDILVDKLGIADTEAGRDALRKGVGAGVAAGALALILSSRSGRKLAALGGLSGLGLLAYKAYQKNGNKAPNWKDEVIGLISGPKAEIRTEALLRAMVAAARADNDISAEEMAILNAHNKEAHPIVADILNQPPNAQDIARLADSKQAAREIYAASCRIADGLNTDERDYLDELAMALELSPELAARIETDVRVGHA